MIHPLKAGDKVVALDTSSPDPRLSGVLVKGVIYTVRDWHEGHVGPPEATQCIDGSVSTQIVNVVGIEGEQVWHVQPGRTVEYGWHHSWFRRIWTQTTSVSSSIEQPATP